jgi:hypothetical protein
MNTFNKAQTEEDFTKARNKALFNEIQHFLNPEETELLSFTDIKKWLKPKNEVYLGMQVVPVNLIAGSEGRFKDFDNHFFPRNVHLKSRWERIDEARLYNVILPPILLYEIGGLYFVRDGNHRVSVARSQGIENIDAEVISLKSEIKLRPGMTKRQILKAVLHYEKRTFYAETGFGDITDDWNIDFTSPGEYDVLYNHILIHKYYINMNQTEEIPLHEAVLSWYQNVYTPLIQILISQKIMKKFKHNTLSDMYVWIIKYWDELKEKFGSDVSLDDAATEFSEKYGKTIFQRIVIWCKKQFQKT